MTKPACQPYLPPEWAPQSAVMLTWPHDQGDWARRLTEVEPVFADIAYHISRHERVLITGRDAAQHDQIVARLTARGVDLGQVDLYIAPSNDTWARDHGPITVMCNHEPVLLDFGFNGWGGKYRADLDDALTGHLRQAGAFGDTPLQKVDLILEGGSIEVDGSGTLLTTSQCLLSGTRNPQLTRAQLERELKAQLGLNRVLWLDHGYLAGDDTDSHIDTLARFCDRRTIAYVRCDDPSDEHYPALRAMEQELRALVSAEGTPYRLQPLPWPRARYDEDGQRLPATYANFLIINGAVLAPLYDDPRDGEAMAALQTCFPDREIIGIRCLPLIYQYGSLHCITMQLPAGVLPERTQSPG